MEVTNRQVISDVHTELVSFNVDQRVSNRFILSRLKDKIRYFIKQDLDSRRLFKISKIWSTIKCLKMKPIDFIECGLDIPHCKQMMRSVKKIPDSFDSNYGNIVKVFTIDGDKEYTQIKIGQYKNIKNREFQDPNKRYFWIDDDYIFIPDSEVVEVMVVGLFERPEEVDKLNDEKGSDCAKPLDSYFPAPKHLLDVAKKELIVELARVYKGLPMDETPNQNTNIK